MRGMIDKPNIAAKTYTLRMRVREFLIPPIRDGLVIGTESPIGCAAIRKALDLLAANTFEHIELQDDVVSDVLIRAALLRRLPREKMIEFVLRELKPLMSKREVLHLDFEVELGLEATDL
jgi:hypothetical protein